ncbi:MAG: GDP-L-fucose synthase [Bacteroidetes bacterium HGW-Bacteroidetes-5]|jgi:GDP-L-fucose synthase|nr:MAG: GDP-L-fucose synthase [Bacteroidetes bacterium HGW-Bacteroidetes-5]
MMNKNSKIYVAGHLGLVGSAILANLKSKDYHNFVLRSLDQLDLTNQTDVDLFFKTEQPEYIFLAAAKVGGIMANNTYRAQFIYENITIQNNVIHSSWKYGVKKLLFLGSTCIYPKNAPQPMSEDELLTSPLEYTNEPYAIAKIAGIKMCESYNLQYGTNFLSVMPTNLYGPNDNFNLETSHVLPALIRKIYLGKCLENNDWESVILDLNKRPINGVNGSSAKETIMNILAKYGISKPNSYVSVEIWGTGAPLREFLWSEEMADACVFVMENVNFCDVAIGSEIRNTHINIGTGEEITIKDLAHLIKSIVGFQGELCFDPTKPDGTMRKLTNPSKINSLGWNHKINIQDGIRILFDWYTIYY